MQAAAGRLSLPLLRNRIANGGDRLARTGFTPQLLDRGFAHARDRLAGLERLLPQLHPDKPLDRGFVRVTDRSGQTLTQREQAARQQLLVLKFRDGDLPVTPDAGARRPAAEKPPPPRQGDLF